ncbi:sensor histidine kinase [Thioflexithrix psekupsensis]|nr:histidine kinase [Thioflexithrix psekupsensis]
MIKKTISHQSNDRLFLPNFCNVRTVFVTVIFVQLLAFILVLSLLGRPHYGFNYLQYRFFGDLALTSLFMHWVALLSLGLLCLLRRWLILLDSNLLAALFSYALILTVTAVASELAWILREYIVDQVNFSLFPLYQLLFRNVLLVGLVLVAIFIPLAYFKWVRFHLLLMIFFVSLIATALFTELLHLFSVRNNEFWPYVLQHQLFLLRNLAISAIVSAIALRYFYMRNEWKLKTVAHATSRLQALQARIRPHFLFNSMNTIASLIRCDPERAEQAVEDLSDLFRASLSHGGHYVDLATEINWCQQYLRVEALRLEDRLRVDWQIDNVPKDALIPPLCLQPLLENAVYYGIQPATEGGIIHVTGLFDGRDIKLEVENSLPEQFNLDHKGNRIAQDNIHQRLQACFGYSAGLNITIEPDNYRVSLRFPYHTELPS